MAFYKNGKITIPEVLGDIAIEISARKSADETLPIEWKEGYTCPYSVGAVCTATAAAGYYCTELIPVKYGKKYVLNLSVASTNPPRFVGVGYDGKVTETASYSPGSKQYVWTPSEEQTIGLRLRGYHDVFAQVSDVTLLKVI